jgi:PAS domain-containing protein
MGVEPPGPGGAEVERRAEAELRAAAERYRQLFERSPLPMWVPPAHRPGDAWHHRP